MEELIITTAVAVLIPVIGALLKKVVGKAAVKNMQLTIKDINGKEQKIEYSGELDLDVVQRLVEKEYELEAKVENILKRYKKQNKNFHYTKNHSVDFLLRFSNHVVGLEVKRNNSLPSKKYFNSVKESHPELEQLLFLFDSEVPQRYLHAYENDSFVKFISSPREKNLSEKLTSYLNKMMSSLA
ncbi:hypothetical protein RYH74_08305 [Pseudomonas sp. LSJ-87]|uniref:hypothetical protein n=1 Tax=Pseudomonas sp. LSJ-87 TaxID=3079932 RepID=UPI002940DC13|nr:hypothetical protein [Pseudomonas sp. LSJ-87]MDV5097289.1 hypothetical protein [Pseudomonas sp. LSJ-87]